jgi:PAS domain S-box-containing protein
MDAFPLQSYGTLLLSGVALSSAALNLVLYARRRRRSDLTFGLCSLSVAAFDLFCAFTYASSSTPLARASLQAQWVALSAAFFFFFRFSYEFLGLPRSRAEGPAGLVLLLFGLAQALNPAGLAWTAAEPAVRSLTLPVLGLRFLVLDFPAGPLTLAQIAFCYGLALHLLWMSVRQARLGERRALGLALAVGFLLLTGFKDGLAMAGGRPAFYVFDYAFAGVLGLMAVGMARELAATAEMRESLRLAEQRFRHLEQQSHEVIWELNQHGVLAYASPKVAQLTGWTTEDLLGARPWELLPEAEALRVDEAWKAFVGQGLELHALEFSTRRRDGSPLTLEISGYPFLDPAGRLRGYRGIVRDVTVQRREARASSQERQRRGLAALARAFSHDLGKLSSQLLRHTGAAMKEVPPGSPGRASLESADQAAAKLAKLSCRTAELFDKINPQR